MDVHSTGAVLTRDAIIEWVGDAADLPPGLRPERTVELANAVIVQGYRLRGVS
jgi:hypothetical protein